MMNYYIPQAHIVHLSAIECLLSINEIISIDKMYHLCIHIYSFHLYLYIGSLSPLQNVLPFSKNKSKAVDLRERRYKKLFYYIICDKS